MISEQTVTSTPSIIVLKDVTKVYQTRTGPILALDRFTGEIREGEFVCIVGPSGCGKTTLLWAMTGLHAITSGQILLSGSAVTGSRPELCIVFQESNLLPWRTVQQNIELPFEIRHRSAHAHRENIRALLETVGLGGFEHK